MKTKYNSAAILIALLATAALSSGSALGAGIDARLPEIPVDLALKIVKTKLISPESAKFEGVYVVRAPAGKDGIQRTMTCGWVSAKDAFEADVGKTRFAVNDVIQPSGKRDYGVVIETEEGKRAFNVPPHGRYSAESFFENVVWNASCVDSQHPPTHTARPWVDDMLIDEPPSKQ